jgi:hypothetical protein
MFFPHIKGSCLDTIQNQYIKSSLFIWLSHNNFSTQQLNWSSSVQHHQKHCSRSRYYNGHILPVIIEIHCPELPLTTWQFVKEFPVFNETRIVVAIFTDFQFCFISESSFPQWHILLRFSNKNTAQIFYFSCLLHVYPIMSLITLGRIWMFFAML